MIAVHFLYDLTEIYPVFETFPPYLLPVKNHGGTVFFLLSGISATLGRRCLKRGCTVLGCAALVSIITRLAGSPVRFGVLHCLGLCMVLWAFFRKLQIGPLLLLGTVFILTGIVFQKLTVSPPFLYPLGLCRKDFLSADFFPLFPYLGYFLVGAVLGRRLYPTRRNLLKLSFHSPLSRFFCFCGRHALSLYLLHQPVLLLAIETAYLLGGNFYET